MSEAGVASEKVRNIFSNFEKKFQEETKDPDKFLTISELESRWATLRKDILECGDEMVRRLVESVDEKDLVKKKKGISRPRSQSHNKSAFRDRDAD